MKNVLFISGMLFFSFTFSQTKEIAHKSHSGTSDTYNPNDYVDNFGNPPEVRENIKKVTYYKKNCVIVSGEKRYWSSNLVENFSDTLCDHPYYSGQYTLEEIKRFYTNETEFIGFKGKFFNDSIPQKRIHKSNSKKNSLYIFAILLFLGSGSFYVFRPSK